MLKNALVIFYAEITMKNGCYARRQAPKLNKYKLLKTNSDKTCRQELGNCCDSVFWGGQYTGSEGKPKSIYSSWDEPLSQTSKIREGMHACTHIHKMRILTAKTFSTITTSNMTCKIGERYSQYEFKNGRDWFRQLQFLAEEFISE